MSKSECEELVARVGLDHRDLVDGARVEKMKSAAFFFYKSRMKEAGAVATCLVDYVGNFTWAILWAYGFPWGDRSREENPPADWKRYSQWRQSAGDVRSLYDAPGHLFDPNDKVRLAEVIEFAIYTGWDAFLLARPLSCVIALSHDDLIAVQSRHNVTALSAELGRFGLSRRDFHGPPGGKRGRSRR